MHFIDVRNVSDALITGLNDLKHLAVKRDSRNGPVMVFPEPVMTRYQNPKERVIFFPERDANPFFHFMESLWMISGRNDVAWVGQFSSNIANYSDDGVTFHGAYGYRWRQHFDVDQIETVIDLFRANKDDRRVLMQMWDPRTDLDKQGKDFPCNLTIIPSITPYGKLDMTVINRSNDIIWGAYGANAVHMSMLQEYMAAMIGVEVGAYYQFSTNFHGYIAVMEKHAALMDLTDSDNPYLDMEPFPMVKNPSVWDSELAMFMDEDCRAMGYTEPFFKRVAVPMMQTWLAWKDRENPDRLGDALMHTDNIAAPDWRKACVEWLERRSK